MIFFSQVFLLMLFADEFDIMCKRKIKFILFDFFNFGCFELSQHQQWGVTVTFARIATRAARYSLFLDLYRQYRSILNFKVDVIFLIVNIRGSAKNITLTYPTNLFFDNDVATFCHNLAVHFFLKIVA